MFVFAMTGKVKNRDCTDQVKLSPRYKKALINAVPKCEDHKNMPCRA
ncbi:MAG: hypothetical protein OFPI_44570 [Osedax symbiont Rs2]|nr:MAG: hypothetical protein OFPI_44570 [Osedax symbiont Rs2]